jgi:hypothetical protein
MDVLPIEALIIFSPGAKLTDPFKYVYELPCPHKKRRSANLG